MPILLSSFLHTTNFIVLSFALIEVFEVCFDLVLTWLLKQKLVLEKDLKKIKFSSFCNHTVFQSTDTFPL